MTGLSGGAVSGVNGLPAWLVPVAEAVDTIRPEDLSIRRPPREEASGRKAAVLILFGEDRDGPDVLLTERSHDMRSHAAQVSFPGGIEESGDDGPADTAVREAMEETGLDPAGVEVFGTLPTLWMPFGDVSVTPVLAWWREPCEVSAVDPAEVHAVRRVPIGDLTDPANRYTVRHPSGFMGPAFVVDGLFVWGFTAGLISQLFLHVDWEKTWDKERYTELPDHIVERIGRYR
ncbi:MAG: NUDIX domain-containing protein [Propionibacteriales bacterium]|nr:NUDIX domain-containing protein [Propionibacteriales bacterium]